MSIPTHDLLPACRVLFGAHAGRGTDFLESLREDLVQKVFRQLAFETHPDRAGSAGLDPLVMTRRFQEVNAAKELLNRYLADRGNKARPVTRKASAPPKRRATPSSDFFWPGRVPDLQLPLGEYLYYSGHVSLQALIAAIHSQRTQRPFFGLLAAQRGYLPLDTVDLLVSAKRPGERLGETALRLRVLTSFQRDVILGLQRARQRPFGRFFTESGLLADVELGELVRAQFRHNFRRAVRRAS